MRRSLLALLLCLPLLSGADNPHASPDRCAACHEPGETPSKPGTARSSIVTCSGCHAAAAGEMHAVGRAPKDAVIPAGWPLEHGLVACATCHAEPSCDPTRPQAPPWSRGGPYAESLQMCWQCHSEEGMDREDPHHPGTLRDPADRSCSACHLRIPAQGAAASDSSLLQDPDGLCAFCHEQVQHSGMASHMGAVLGDLKGERPDLFPLDSDGKIACWTCHEVHRDGDAVKVAGVTSEPLPGALRERLLARDWLDLLPPDVVWPETQAPRYEHTPMLVLPLRDGQLCVGCHGRGP